MDTKDLDIYVSSDLYRAGTDEDGEDYIAEYYFLMAEAKDGRRWVHRESFEGAEYYEHADEEWGGSYGYRDIREEAEAKAEALLAQVKKAGVIDLAKWKSTYSAYGSSSHNEAELIAWERNRG